MKGKEPIDVFFYIGRTVHPFYKEIFKYPPENVNFIPSTPKLSETEHHKEDIKKAASSSFRAETGLKRAITGMFQFAGIPTVRYSASAHGDLIHSANIMLLNTMPMVMDMEEASVFCGHNYKTLRNGRYGFLLRKLMARGNLRKILPWTEASATSLGNTIDTNGLNNKIEVAYPVMTPKKFTKKKSQCAATRLLFVGGLFYPKGGHEALAAFEQLSKKYDVQLDMVCRVPESYISKYSKLKNLNIHANVPEDELKQLYQSADLFLFPSHFDTFGFVCLEAMSYELPIVSSDVFALPEIVQDEKTGLLVRDYAGYYDYDCRIQVPMAYFMSGENHPFIRKLQASDEHFVNELTEKTAALIENPSLCRKMGTAGREEIENGRFSPSSRKEQMRRIYEEAVRK